AAAAGWAVEPLQHHARDRHPAIGSAAPALAFELVEVPVEVNEQPHAIPVGGVHAARLLTPLVVVRGRDVLLPQTAHQLVKKAELVGRMASKIAKQAIGAELLRRLDPAQDLFASRIEPGLPLLPVLGISAANVDRLRVDTRLLDYTR